MHLLYPRRRSVLPVLTVLVSLASTACGGDVGPQADTEGSAMAVSTSGSEVTGASLATCRTTPCQPGSLPSSRAAGPCVVGPTAGNIIGLGSISDGSTAECRFYGYYQPANLTGSPAAVFLASGSGTPGDEVGSILAQSRWNVTADQNRLMVVVLARPKVPSVRAAWYHQNIDAGGGAPGTPLHSDEPYLAAVVADAKARFHLDAGRLYFTGGSSGGALTYDVACDVTNSPLFRGYAAVSDSAQTQLGSDGKSVKGSERCPSTNRSFFFELVMGTHDATQYNGVCNSDHCIASFTDTAAFWASHLGCAANPQVTSFGAPVAANSYHRYPACPLGSSNTNELRAVYVANGGHVWSGLDDASNGAIDTNGYATAHNNWEFFASRRWLQP